MDHWSLNSFLRGDAAMLYLGIEPVERAPFKEFVSLCSSIDTSKADSFWAARFKDFPSIYPPVALGICPRPSKKLEKTLTLDLAVKGISESHIAWYAEAAWALTIATYVDNESIAYGIVMSGRSSMLGEAGHTLGPTTVEIPVQVNIHPNMTVETLIKGRAASLRELKAEPLLLQYGLPNIAATSNAASMASKFQSLFNIVPPQSISLPTTDEQEKSVALDNVIKHSRGGFALTFNCRLVGDDIMLEALYDPAILASDEIQHILDQFEHDLGILIEVPSGTKIGQLQRLNHHDCTKMLEWNTAMGRNLYASSAADRIVGDLRDKSWTSLGKMAYGFWIVDPKDNERLLPIGSVGELFVEHPSTLKGTTFRPQFDLGAVSTVPSWANDLCKKSTRLLRTSALARYDHDGRISVIGRHENRIRLAGRVVQLEHIEKAIKDDDAVRGAVVLPKIVSGRTRLVAILTLVGHERTDLRLMPEEISPGSVLVGGEMPIIWHVVGRLPRLEDESIDRSAVRDWLKTLR
ncbi:CoA-dependent acyltransferase [Aureobasidium subglaciale]|nr:CoA-dependent acyltransferase [Aureobasidium subglaciale]KAI5213708.1 CoA-dependent acyltransferase [Aureobasidium subglaciale]KAI5215534.1 CoA-dependent acyltransferase [Aureobasidium subglaciale]KAI5253357.1 CoA-dependent acyltransferase [Aureobasidium subglaciale]